MMISDDRYNNMLQANEAFRTRLEVARNGLRQIKQMKHKRDTYSLGFAENTIKNMKKIAKRTLERIE